MCVCGGGGGGGGQITKQIKTGKSLCYSGFIGFF